jgi:hypothetical protein
LPMPTNWAPCPGKIYAFMWFIRSLVDYVD